MNELRSATVFPFEALNVLGNVKCMDLRGFGKKENSTIKPASTLLRDLESREFYGNASNAMRDDGCAPVT